jgi:Flp pilus assembly pilin Flp
VTWSLLTDDQGQDLIEYALLVGLIAVACVLVFPIVRVQMAAAYQNWLSNAQSISAPPPPL